jgi:TPP-dependent 2-oxoacid decarboxylase
VTPIAPRGCRSQVNTANELNAGYAADGHARAQGLGCVVTT